MLLDIVILPPQKVRIGIGKLTATLKKDKGVKWMVDNKKLIPHISLFHLKVKESDLDHIFRQVQEIVKNNRPMVLGVGDKHAHHLYFDIRVKLNKQLYKLHKQFMEGLYGLRSANMPLVNQLKNFKARIYYRKFGAPGLLSNYHPHITLGWVKKQENIEAVMAKLSNKSIPKSFIANTVAITEIDKYWQVTKVLKTFKLK